MKQVHAIHLMLALATIMLGCIECGWALSFRANLDPIIVQAVPGNVINRTFSLTLSPKEQPTHFKTQIEDYWRSEDAKKTFYQEPGTVPNSCGKWVQINPVEQRLQPGETFTVRLSITVPKDAKPGGYWCALTVDEVLNPDHVKPEGTGIFFNTSVSVVIFVFVGPLERVAKITDVQVTSQQASVKLRNDGNCPLLVEGRFEFLRPGETKPVATAPISLGALLLAPVNTRIFTADLPDVKTLPPGRYLVRAILDIGLDHYIGVQKELDVTSAILPPSKAKPKQD